MRLHIQTSLFSAPHTIDGLKPAAGTKLVSRYGVIVVDDGQVGNNSEARSFDG